MIVNIRLIVEMPLAPNTTCEWFQYPIKMANDGAAVCVAIILVAVIDPSPWRWCPRRCRNHRNNHRNQIADMDMNTATDSDNFTSTIRRQSKRLSFRLCIRYCFRLGVRLCIWLGEQVCRPLPKGICIRLGQASVRAFDFHLYHQGIM